ncbi:carboxypeptidase-like regulatory domain-containing protein [Candidatus Palauibacter sp.]|uniref:carboxypeptidase-like regulatory domain-containing protein n=1 Tax=Candidatus Palauibacter sp. TaxID=3101350 RepID=UPI003B52F1B9
MPHKQGKTGPAAARAALLANLGLGLLALPATAQEARPRLLGILLTEGSGAPVEGAHVRLVDPDELVLAEDISDPRGAFGLPMPPAGVYRLLVARIGYESWASDTLHVDWSGESRTLRLHIPVEPIPLPELSVSEENVCPTTPEERAQAFALYESVLPILATVSHTDDLGSLRMRIVRPVKYYFAQGTYRFRPDTVAVITSRSLYNPSPEHLVARGYADVVDTMTTFYAPDGDALASPGFLATHCLRPVESADEATIGLGFEPKPGREVVDIAGVLWIDTVAGGPRELEFQYTSLRPFLRQHLEPALRSRVQSVRPSSRLRFFSIEIDESRFGGDLYFQRIRRDRWLIREWRIRRPELRHRGNFSAGSAGQIRPFAVPLAFSGEVLALIPP